MYQIEYHYRTGDSFHTEDRTKLLEYEWENIKVAKESLKRIKEHYTWYQYMEGPRWRDKVPKPKWHSVKFEYKDQEHVMINIPMDDGQEVQFWPPWCGYFETLYGAKIVLNGKDMAFEL
jgi:hypothetical protein